MFLSVRKDMSSIDKCPKSPDGKQLDTHKQVCRQVHFLRSDNPNILLTETRDQMDFLESTFPYFDWLFPMFSKTRCS